MLGYIQSEDAMVNMYQKLAALKLIKECNEAIFKLVIEGHSVMYVRTLGEKLIQINESGQIR
jgi:uncharacterized protein with PhoU and TrkA domain